MAAFKKQIIARVSSSANATPLAIWTNFSFEGFSKELNSGAGECVLELDKAFDYDGGDLAVGNDVELTVSDRDTVTLGNDSNVRTVYQGYVSLIEREVTGRSERVRVHLLGYYTLLATDILKNGTQTTLYSNTAGGLSTTGPSEAADIGKMMRTVLDRYRAENANPKINYDPGDIPDTGTTATYQFEQKTYRDALNKLKTLAPPNVYWYADVNGAVKFKTVPTTATHQFVFGKHFTSIKTETSLEKTRNFLLVWNGETGGSAVYKHYQDDQSVSLYGRRAQPLNDYGIDNSNAADAIGAKFLAENQNPEVKAVCEVIDNNGDPNFGYDIESIQPGDTCSFYGFAGGLTEIFLDNMLITKVVYSLDKVELTMEAVKSGLLDWQEQASKEAREIASNGLPLTYT